MANNTVKPKGEGWSAIINGVEVRQVNGGLMLGTGLDSVFIHGDQLRLVDPTTKMQGHYPDNYPFTAPHDHVFDEENIDLVLDRTYPYDGIPLELLPKAIRELKGMLLGNVSIKANFPTNEITGEYTGTLQKGDLVTWDKDAGEWVAASCPVARGLTDNALFTGVAFPDSDEILSASNVVCDAWDLVPGQAYYLDCANPGKMTDQDTGYYVGVAQSKTAMYFAPYASSVEQVITKLQEQVSAVDTAMQDLQTAFEGVQTTVEEMQAIVEEVKANDEQVNDKLQNLATQAQTTNTQLLDALTRIGQLEATDATHQAYFNSIASQFQTVTTTISNMAASLAQSDEEIRQNAAKMRKELDEIQELLNTGAGKWAELVEKHEADIAAINEKLGDCTCASITERFEGLDTTIETNRNAHDALQEAFDSHKEDYQTLKEGHDILYNQVQAEVENVKANTEGILQLSSRTSALETDLTAHKAQAETTFESLKEEDLKNTGLIEGNKGLIQANAVAIEALRNDLTTGLATAQTSLDSVKENLQEQITSNDGELETLTTQVGTNTTGLASAVTRILNIENMLDEGFEGKCECDFSEINKTVADNAARLTDLSNAHSVTANTVTDIARTVENLTNATTESSEKMKQYDTAISELDLDIINAKNEFQADQDKQNTTIQNLKDWVNGLQNKQTAHEEDASSKFATINGKLDAIEAGGGSTSADLTALSIKVSQNESGVAANKAAIDAMSPKVSQAESAITELRADHVSIESSIAKNKEDIATQAGQITTLGTNVTDLTSATNTINSTVSSITDRLSTVEGAIKDSTCECDLSTVNKAISDLSTTVSDLETNQGKVEDFLGFEDGVPPVSEEGKSLIEEINGLDTRVTALEAGGGTGGSGGEVDLTPITSRLTAVETKNGTQDGRLTALETGQSTNAESVATLQTSLSDLSTKQTACCDKVEALEVTVGTVQTTQTECCSKVTKLEGDVAELTADVESIKDVVDTSGGGTVTRVVTAPDFTLPNFIKGEFANIGFSSSSLLADGKVVSIKVKVPALSYDQNVPVSEAGWTSISLPLGDTEAGTVIAVSAYAVDNLGNTSEIVTKSGTVLEKAIATPTITSVTGQNDLWASGLTVTPSAFSMEVGTDTLSGATVTVRNSADTSTLATKEFTGAGPYTLAAAELQNLWNGGSFKVKLAYKSAGGLTSPTASYDVTVIGASVKTPTLSSPVASAEIDKSGSLVVTTSAFAKTPANAPIKHTKTDYKVTSDAAGNNVVLSAMASTDLTSHTFSNLSALAEDTTYYVWARHHGSID